MQQNEQNTPQEEQNAAASEVEIVPSEAADAAPPAEEAQETQPPAEGSDEWFAMDGRRFAEAYPDLDREALFADPHFLDYAEGKVGTRPLADIYEGYQRLRGSLTPSRADAARAHSAGSLRQVAAPAEAEYYTLEEMKAMSPAYIEQHWDKVQKSLSRLNQ